MSANTLILMEATNHLPVVSTAKTGRLAKELFFGIRDVAFPQNAVTDIKKISVSLSGSR
jgi:hypothetical protein